jgi:hypothetical protein
MRNWIVVLAAVVALLGVSPLAQATPLAPGTSVVPDVSPELGTYTGLSVSGAFSTAKTAGTYLEAVYKEGGGTLDFVYQVTVTKGDVGRLTSDNFGAYTVSASQFALPPVDNTPGFVIGTVAAATADRTADGDVIGFNFTPVQVTAGFTSVVLIIRTDAIVTSPNDLSFIDALTASVTGIGPAPEPTTLLLFAGMSVGMGGVGLWRRWKRQPIVA